jgi:hypothetical protein
MTAPPLPLHIRIRTAAILAAATLLFHGWSLGDGLFLDDHWHTAQYAKAEWSWAHLVESATIAPQRFIECWWQETPLHWQYARPFALLAAQATYLLSGESAVALHAASVLLHFAVALLVAELAFRLTRSARWSCTAGLLFVIYLHTPVPVAWPAAQNALLQTALMLAALLLYCDASGLDLTPRPAEAVAAQAVKSLGRWRFGASFGLWVLALLSRENALMLPPLLVGFDLAYGGWRTVRMRWPAYLAFALVGGVFLAWRLTFPNMPDVYFRPNDGGDYWAWLAAKLLHYLCCAVWLNPLTVGPTGRFEPWRDTPLDLAIMAGIVIVFSVGYVVACRRVRGWWLWPAWLLLAVLPVAPVLATPHSGYLPGVAFAIAMVLGPGTARVLKPDRQRRISNGVAIGYLVAMSACFPLYRMLWNSFRAAENYTVACLRTQPPPVAARDVYFINLPFVNVYAKFHLARDWDSSFADKSIHALTYAPNILAMDQPTRIVQLDDHAFRVEVDGQPWFSRLLGRFLIDAMRRSGPLKPGDNYKAKNFHVTVDDAGPEGVRALTFRFNRALDDPEHAFYVSTPDHGGVRLRFANGTTGPRPIDLPSLSETERPDVARLRRTRDLLFLMRDFTRNRLGIRSDLYLTGPPYPGPRPR